MPYPSAAEYLGKLSGIDGAKDYPWGKPDLVPATEQDAAIPKEYPDGEVKEYYRPQTMMIEQVCNLSRKLVTLLNEVDGLLAVIQEKGWENNSQLHPYPLEGSLRPLKSTDLAPAMGAAIALKTFMDTPLVDLGGVTPKSLLIPLAVLGRDDRK